MFKSFPLRAVLAAASVTASLGLVSHSAHADPKVLKKVPPEFPAEATRKQVTDGVLKTKLTIDGTGAVTDVQIVEASPPPARVFSKAATAALMNWKFEASGKPETAEIRLVFSQE